MPIASILLLLTLTPLLLASAQHGTVKSNSLPIPGATVTAIQGATTHAVLTGENGDYVFEELPPGPWDIAVEMIGFLPLRRNTTIGATNSPLDFDLVLQPPPAQRPPASRPGQAPGAPFQQMELNQNLQQELQSAMRAEPVQADSAMSSSESFLVSGSLSRGLQLPSREDDFFAMRPDGPPFAGGPPGMEGMGGGPPGMGPGGPPGMGGGGPPGMGGGPPGMGGGPGMMRGGGGPPGMGGPGGGMGRGPVGGMGGGPGMMRGGGPPAMARGEGRGERREAPRLAKPAKAAKGDKPAKGEKAVRKAENIYARARVARFGNRSNRGQDSLRGGLSFSLRNSALDATPYSLSGQNITKPSYAQSRFNLSLGGMLHIPKIISDDKTFFFLNYSGGRSRNPFDSIATLPSAAERAGDFSNSIIRLPVTIFDPANSLPFPGNRIPASRIHAASRELLSLMPLPNQPGLVQNYQYLTSNAQNSNNLGLRLGRAISRKDRLNGAFNLQNRAGNNAQLYGFRDESSGRGMSANLTWTHNLRTGLISNARLNYSSNRSETIPFFAYGRDYARELGIAGTSTNPVNFGPPNLNFTNFGGLNDASPALRRDQTLSLGESIMHIKGKHNTSFGGEYRRSQLNNRNEQNARGTFTFSGLATSGFSADRQPLPLTGFDFADYLLGFPQSSSIRFGNPDTYFRGSAYSLYAQDDWRLRSNLTINAGLRYEFQSPFHEKYGRMANLDIAPGFTGVTPVLPGQPGPYTGPFSSGLIDADRNNFSPRVALAWKPRSKGKMVVRAAYGWYYNNSIYNQAASRLAQQPPFASTGNINTSLANVLTIQDGFSAAPSQSITNTFAVARGYRAGYAQTWSLSAQQELPNQLILELGYIGTKGTRLDIQRLPNRAAPGSPLTAEQRRRIGNAVGFTYDTSEGSSIYHAGQARLSRRFRRGLSANALYTFAKSIDNVSTFGGGGTVVVQDDRNLDAERGISSFDSRHNFNVSFLLSSSGRGGAATRNGFAGPLLRDWTFSGAFSARAGSPFTARVLGNKSDSGGTGVVGSGRADATGLPVHSGQGFFNALAFAIPPGDRFGNAARNTIPGPNLVTFDLSLARNFALGESRRNIDLRIESNNLLNNVNYNRLATTINASNYGLATGVASMRTFQAHLRFRF